MKKIAFIVCAGLASAVLLASKNTDSVSAEDASTVQSPCIPVEYNPIGLSPGFPWSKEPVEFHYDVDSRFMADYTKEQLKDAKSIIQFDSRISEEQIVSIQSTSVSVLNDKYEQVEKVQGSTLEFNDAQMKLLRSAPYSADILIRMDYLERSHFNDGPQNNYTTPHLTIVPEKQAKFEGGRDGLVAYLRIKSRDAITMAEEDKLKPGKVRFTISKKGKVKDVILISSSGYDSIDERMVGLITDLPGKWKPAENLKGQKVDEQLVFSFGLIGC